MRSIEAHCILVSFSDNRQPGGDRSAECAEQLSAHASVPRVWRGCNMKQGYSGIAHRVADHTGRVVVDDRDEEARGGIIAVAPNNVLQTVWVIADRECQ